MKPLHLSVLLLLACSACDDASHRSISPGTNDYYACSEHPNYLQVIYVVDVQSYDPALESRYFLKSLEILKNNETRGSAPRNCDYYAIAIKNYRDHKGESTFASSHKAGLIISRHDVDRTDPANLVRLIAPGSITHDGTRLIGATWQLIREHSTTTRPSTPTSPSPN